jgi:DNA-binding transcriptional ArsR family regulator
VVAYRHNGWTALGDPTRRAIFERLADSPQAVGELARELPVSRPAVSQHLRVLKDAGLVRFWSRALAAYKTVVEQPTKEVS